MGTKCCYISLFPRDLLDGLTLGPLHSANIFGYQMFSDFFPLSCNIKTRVTIIKLMKTITISVSYFTDSMVYLLQFH